MAEHDALSRSYNGPLRYKPSYTNHKQPPAPQITPADPSMLSSNPANHTTTTSNSIPPTPAPPPSRLRPRPRPGSRLLLRRHPRLHLPPRRENHVVPPLAQQRLPLVLVRAPPLLLPRLPVLCTGPVLGPAQFVLQVVPRDEVGLLRLGGLLRLRLGARGRGGRAEGRRRLEGDRRLSSSQSVNP